jgi:hypothetical protein
MPKEVQIWRVGSNDRLEPINAGSLNLESRIEEWLANDISVLDPDLLVIGRQVRTESDGAIDLLCIDREGSLAVVELKRHKTARDVTAQTLDYASWVNSLSGEQVTALAAAYLKPRSLTEAFAARFGSDLPDTINSDHRMIIVGSTIDDASERIIQYLSDVHGVNINSATFQYFKLTDGSEQISRVFLIPPARVEQRSISRGNSKRARRLTPEQLHAQAEANGVRELFTHAVSRLEETFLPHETQSSMSFYDATKDGRRASVKLLPEESTSSDGLRFQLYSVRVCRYRDITDAALRAVLPKNCTHWQSPNATESDGIGVQGFLTSRDDVDRLVDALSSRRD